jgi:hypothetical protein
LFAYFQSFGGISAEYRGEEGSSDWSYDPDDLICDFDDLRALLVSSVG